MLPFLQAALRYLLFLGHVDLDTSEDSLKGFPLWLLPGTGLVSLGQRTSLGSSFLHCGDENTNPVRSNGMICINVSTIVSYA